MVTLLILTGILCIITITACATTILNEMPKGKRKKLTEKAIGGIVGSLATAAFALTFVYLIFLA